MSNKKQVAVIGAGIAGISAAYYLAKEGFEVHVYEQEKYPALRTSFANGGQISVCNAEVWTNWATVQKGMKWMFKKDAPLLFNPMPEPRKVLWLLGFLKNTILNKYQSNTIKTILMGLHSRALYAQIAQEEGLAFDQSECGLLHMYKDKQSFMQGKAVQEMFESNGCPWIEQTPEEMIKLDSALENITGLVGGFHTPTDWTGDIHKFCKQLWRVLESKYGVSFNFETKITSVNAFTQKGAIEIDEELKFFDFVVLSNGADIDLYSSALGNFLNVYPVKGYSITIPLESESSKEAPHISLLDDAVKIVSARLGDRLRVAGTAELAGFNRDIRMQRIEPLVKWVQNNFPNIDTSNYQAWACLRPMASDMMPIVKPSAISKHVWYHGGHGHLGWTLSAATGLTLAQRIKEL